MNPAASTTGTRIDVPAPYRVAHHATAEKAGAQGSTEHAKQADVEAGRISEQALRVRLEQALQQLNEQLRQNGREIGFSLEPESGLMVVNVTNLETGELVRQIPLKAFAKVAEHADQLKGLLLDEMR